MQVDQDVMDMTSHECADMATFIAELRARSLTRSVLAWRDEYGPVATASGGAEYRSVRTVVLLAYQQGTIVSCDMTDGAGDRAGIRAALAAAGISCEERCRNLGAPRRPAARRH
jgi:hypothetical protein